MSQEGYLKPQFPPDAFAGTATYYDPARTNAERMQQTARTPRRSAMDENWHAEMFPHYNRLK